MHCGSGATHLECDGIFNVANSLQSMSVKEFETRSIVDAEVAKI